MIKVIDSFLICYEIRIYKWRGNGHLHQVLNMFVQLAGSECRIILTTWNNIIIAIAIYGIKFYLIKRKFYNNGISHGLRIWDLSSATLVMWLLIVVFKRFNGMWNSIIFCKLQMSQKWKFSSNLSRRNITNLMIMILKRKRGNSKLWKDLFSWNIPLGIVLVFFGSMLFPSHLVCNCIKLHHGWSRKEISERLESINATQMVMYGMYNHGYCGW